MEVYSIKFLNIQADEVSQELMVCNVIKYASTTAADALTIAYELYTAQEYDLSLISRVVIDIE